MLCRCITVEANFAQGGKMRTSLEIYSLDTGACRVVLQSDQLIEAPNWAPDGGLLVNAAGRLWWASPDGLDPIDTGFATACNNDHGLSPDGTRIALSHRTDGGSTIYTVPVTGGSPVQVTATNPSYWHGWSPDGARLAYVGKRGDAFDIYTCPAEGGEELRLTEGMGHCDGPDYTPDGAWVWFNADGTGSAELWRMRPDGSGRERMTRDPGVNWFPHPSPDGAHVLYLSYPPATQGHPRDRDIELRLISAEGGSSRTLLAFNGGQGTINVPCWAPDGRAFAFVRYGREQ